MAPEALGAEQVWEDSDGHRQGSYPPLVFMLQER